MYQNKRLVIVGRDRERMDQATRLLEGAGFIVTSTSDDGVAIDLVGSSEYAALLIGTEVPLADRRYLATQARVRDAGLAVLNVTSLRSLLTQLNQALGS